MDLSSLETQVLHEYARLADNLRSLNRKTRHLAAAQDILILARLRVLENKMGLVLTLFKASVWGVINQQHPIL